MTRSNSAMPTTLRKASLWYARKGFSVLPCRVREEIPAIDDWQSQATTDPDQIRRWWSENPQYNIGVTATGLRVIELERSRARWFFSSIDRELECPISMSPKGHTYLWFRQGRNAAENAFFESFTRTLPPDVRVYGDGDFVLVPPSFVGGQNFEMN